MYQNKVGVNKHRIKCDSTPTYVISYVYNNSDISKPTIEIFLDLTKAFDTLQHEKLLHKLYKLGRRGVPHTLIKNYLMDRSERLVLNNTIGNEEKIVCGVSQGSIIGPLLFIIYNTSRT